VDFSRLNYPRLAVGLTASALLIISVLFLPWFSYDTESIAPKEPVDEAWICGVGEEECTGFDTFPILRWLLLLAALAPIILAWILVRSHKLSYPPGEMTMVAGFAAFVLIAYNGIIDKPGSGQAEVGLGLDYGYWVALLSSVAIAAVGWRRSLESGARKTRRAPGTV
jgi:hypothetical protein